MLAALAAAAALVTGQVRVTVELVEYYTQKPLVGAQVTLIEDAPDAAQPREVTLTTAAKGKAKGELPHLNFKFKEATQPGYLTNAELAPYRDFVEQQYLDERERRGDDDLYFRAWLIPAKFLDEKVPLRTQDAALKISNDWARDCSQGGPTHIEVKYHVWIVDYPCMQVKVPFRGEPISVVTPDVVSDKPLYPPDEALKDALSSPLKLVGAAVWPNRYKIPSCVYRNDKVLVVNSFCTRHETHSMTVVIMHPERGLAVFRAETDNDALITAVGFDDYRQWVFGSYDSFPGLELAVTLPELIAYETRRIKLAKGGCSATMATTQDKNATCGLKSPQIEQWWDGYFRPLLKNPPPEWYALIKELRKKLKKDARPDPRYEE